MFRPTPAQRRPVRVLLAASSQHISAQTGKTGSDRCDYTCEHRQLTRGVPGRLLFNLLSAQSPVLNNNWVMMQLILVPYKHWGWGIRCANMLDNVRDNSNVKEQKAGHNSLCMTWRTRGDWKDPQPQPPHWHLLFKSFQNKIHEN